jgi:dolichol-phosphate mannosyltransferase
MSIDISIVTPAYGSPQSLPELREQVDAVMQAESLSYELIIVDDRCPKGSWDVARALAEAHSEVVALRLSRNFGQHAAIYAGLRRTSGRRVVVMDCDLQDPPSEIPRLLREAEAGARVVRARRKQRQDNPFRRLVSWAFYATLSALTGVRHSAEVANFGVYDRSVIDALLSWNENHLYFPAAIQWIGFTQSDVDIQHQARAYGKSSYNFKKLFSLAMSIIVSFSDQPLRTIAGVGLVIASLSILVSLVYFSVALVYEFSVPGWASIIVSVWLFSGLILSAIGVTGVYVGQAMREAKGRPNFFVEDIVGHDER